VDKGTSAFTTSGQASSSELIALCLICYQKESGTKANRGAKGKKDEKQEAAKEGTILSKNGENKTEEIFYTKNSCVPPSTLSVKGQIETVKIKGTTEHSTNVL
uniref:Uncharacterized protein n=1 Tax=Anolis carolinensis TaxID=28377 RepID=G1KCX5_ANOCA